MFRNLRRKPRSVRERYAFWYAAGATGVIALVWAVSLQYRLDDTFTTGEFAGDEQMGAFANFFSDARQNFANVISSADDETPTGTEIAPATSTNPLSGPATSSVPEVNDDSRASFFFASSTRESNDPAVAEKEVRIATSTSADKRGE